MERVITGHKVFQHIIRQKDLSPSMKFEDEFVEICKFILKIEDNNIRKETLNVIKKILFLGKIEYDESNSLYNLLFYSAKYDHVRMVVNTETLKKRGKLKQKKDGDLEKTHLAIKFIDSKVSICLFERNKDGIGLTSILNYFNKYAEKYYESIEKRVPYTIRQQNIVSKDFLKSLEKTKRITAVTLTVDEENISISEYAALAGRGDISKNFDIVMRPEKRGGSIKKDTAKDFYKAYKKENSKIKCITIQDSSGNFKFDTEEMKFKLHAKQLEEEVGTSEVKTESIFEYFSQNISNLEKGGE